MVTINSTLISGAGAIPAIAPLLAGKEKILLVSDGNVIKLAPTQQIRALLTANGADLQLIDNVPPEPSQHDVANILQGLGEKTFDLGGRYWRRQRAGCRQAAVRSLPPGLPPVCLRC